MLSYYLPIVVLFVLAFGFAAFSVGAATLTGPRRYNPWMNDSELLDLATGLARRAAAAIEAVKRAGFVVERKSDESPVTEADRVAEALIVEGLRAAAPDIPVVAEEEVEAGVAPAAFKARRFWLVDPLDGTKGFARGGDEYAVCIGLVEDGRVLLGAIALPATGELFGGIVGAGAWKETGEEGSGPQIGRASCRERV